MKERILQGWNFYRILYLLAGSLMIIEGVMDEQWIGLMAGSYFASMGVFRFGCAAGECYRPEQSGDTEIRNK